MSSLRTVTLSLDEYERWFDGNVDDLHHRSPYHDPAWIRATGPSVGFDVAIIGVHDGPTLVGAAPGFLARRGPFCLYGSPLRGTMTSYLGPVVSDPALLGPGLVDLLRACRDHARRQFSASYARFTLRDEPGEPANPVDLGRGWRRQRSPSYRLDLTAGRDAVWSRLKSDCRRNIRRAEREGIEIVPFDEPDRYYRMLVSTFDRHGAKSWHTARFFRSVLTGVPSPEPLLCLGASHRGEVIAAGLFLCDDREVHYVSGASSPSFGSLPTSYLLHWTAIERGIESKCRVFNSDASGVRSIDQFKESFRPELERRCSLIWTRPHIRRAERLFMRSRKLRKRLRARQARPRTASGRR